MKTIAAKWIASLLARGVTPEIVVIEECGDDAINDAERYWIAACRVAGIALANATNGGDGQSQGYVVTPESRAKISASMRGKVMSIETRAKIGAVHKGLKHSAEARAKIAAAMAVRDPAIARMVGDKLTGRKATPTTRAAITRGKQMAGLRANNTSGFKGIRRKANGYDVRIAVNGIHVYIGRARTAEDAARLYDSAARIHFGCEAFLNFPQSGERGRTERG